MQILENLHTLATELAGIARVLPHAPRLQARAPWSPSRLLEERARTQGLDVAILYEDRRITWQELDREVDRAALAFEWIGVETGDVVAVLMDNRPEFLVAVMALNRIGAASALINTNVTGAALVHAVRIAQCVSVLVGEEHREKLGSVLPDIGGLEPRDVWVQHDSGEHGEGEFGAFRDLLAKGGGQRLPKSVEPSTDAQFGYIYTSGTTGLPKAALITNRRILAPGAVVGRGVFAMTRKDTVYVTTPLYHSVGMAVGWGSALANGATLALRRHFSASGFWDDVRRYEATVFVYIGELCRYLLNQPSRHDDRQHSLRIAGGNGLRPDIWEAFQKRFAIPLIREYYGSTEGATMTINMTGKPGMVGRMMPGSQILRCDPETGDPIRNVAGQCKAAGVGETGLFVGKISAAGSFEGYADPEATKKKILEDVFESGDRFFNTGDLLTLHDGRWLSFADRVGDTYRWKGENISTTEVAEILNGAPGVLEANVYGVPVPGNDGKAGMASIHHNEEFDIAGFAAFVKKSMPGYMRPYFVRVQREMKTTATFKHKKVDYRREGYDPGSVMDPLYFLEGERYIPIDEALFASLEDGRVLR